MRADCFRKGITAVASVLLLFLFTLNAQAQSYENHLAFRRKGMGSCTALKGDVVMRIVYVDNQTDEWTQQEKAAWEEKTEKAIAMLQKSADVYGKKLNVETLVFCVTYTDAVPWDYDMFVEKILLQNTALLSDVHQRKNDENVFTVFCFQQEKRSLAYADWDGVLSESIVVNSQDTAVELVHEIMHLFGAVDLYFPEPFEAAASELFPDSVMLATREESVIDSLTAYTVGWTDQPDEEALAFLKRTSHVTQAMLDAAYDEELFTGYAVRENENSIYYGYLRNGLKHGNGVQRWNNGDWYAGEFENGIMHGKGTYYWVGGIIYTGEYEHGKRTGVGILRWPDGTVYTGAFDEGHITGDGMYAWTDGSSFVGSFLDGNYHGYGVYTAADGTITEGYWENGKILE